MPEAGTGLEHEIAQIERQLEAKKEALREQSAELPHDKELLHSVIQEKIAPATPTPAPDPSTSSGSSVLPEELHQKVQALVNTAFIKSIDDAVAEAKATNNAALIDAFHDLLVDELYNHLVERGKLKAM